MWERAAAAAIDLHQSKPRGCLETLSFTIPGTQAFLVLARGGKRQPWNGREGIGTSKTPERLVSAFPQTASRDPALPHGS